MPRLEADSGIVALARRMGDEGYAVFTVEEAARFAPEAGLSRAYLAQGLGRLTRAGWLVRLRRGLYAFGPKFPGVRPTHEWSIAMALARPAAISHWSAMLHHGLTEQLPRITFVTTLKGQWAPRHKKKGEPYRVGGSAFRFVQVLPERFFGHVTEWIGESKVTLTDRERTLLDGLARSELCGGFGEVLAAFDAAASGLDVDRIVDYAGRLDAVLLQRLGWTLEHVAGIQGEPLDRLASTPSTGTRRLDPTGDDHGPIDRRWHLRINSPMVRWVC